MITQYRVKDQATSETVFSGTLGEFLETLTRFQAIEHSNRFRALLAEGKQYRSGMYQTREQAMAQLEAVVKLEAWNTAVDFPGEVPLCSRDSRADVPTPFDRMTSQLVVSAT